MSFSQWLIRDLLLPLDLWRSGDQDQLRYLREFERTQYLPADQLGELQRQRLRRLLEHAYRNCPFYRERFDRAGVVPDDVRTLADLAAVPLLEKQEIQAHRDALVTRGWPAADLVANQTGGSTGRPLSFFVGRDRLRSRAAATIRHNRWAGADVGARVALLWGAPRDRPAGRWKSLLRNLLIDRQLFLDAGHLTQPKLLEFNERLKRFRPRVILAYARAAALFARFLKARNLTPYRPYSVITSAEVLEADDRAVIEEVFGCPVFNRYGCREVSVIASECAAHTGLHVMAEGLVVEVVHGTEAAGPGEQGALVVTDLLNYAMPLIRYRIGDVGAWAAGPCSCGRGLPRLQQVLGRTTDFLVGSDGRLVSGAFLSLYLVGRRPSLGQVQILQERAGQVLFRICRGPAFQAADDLPYLQQTVRTYLGADTVVDCDFVAELMPEPSGKFVFCKSSVANWGSVTQPTV